MSSKYSWQDMSWVNGLANGDRFRAPDGTVWDVEHTNLTMDQCKQIAFADWKKGRSL